MSRTEEKSVPVFFEGRSLHCWATRTHHCDAWHQWEYWSYSCQYEGRFEKHVRHWRVILAPISSAILVAKEEVRLPEIVTFTRTCNFIFRRVKQLSIESSLILGWSTCSLYTLYWLSSDDDSPSRILFKNLFQPWWRSGAYFISKTTTPTPHFISTTTMLDPHVFLFWRAASAPPSWMVIMLFRRWRRPSRGRFNFISTATTAAPLSFFNTTNFKKNTCMWQYYVRTKFVE